MNRSPPPAWAIAIIVATFAAVGFILSYQEIARRYLPFGDSDLLYIALVFVPIVAVVIVAVAVKLVELRQASSWVRGMARITRSGIETRRHRFSGEATTVRNEPAVEYEFVVGGRRFRGNRIGIGEDAGGANTEATLQRYAVGRTVPVYYDPRDPTNCVLERDLPPGVGRGCALAVVAVVVFVAATYYLTTNASRLIGAHLPGANAPFTVFAACFGLAVFLFFLARVRYTRQAKSWPSVRGIIVSSEVEKIERREDGKIRVSYTAAVEFAYRVRDVDYRSRQVKLGVELAGSRSSAERMAARYPAGRPVDVRYEPENPANAALEIPTGLNWILLAVAAACFVVAAYGSGVFGR